MYKNCFEGHRIGVEELHSYKINNTMDNVIFLTFKTLKSFKIEITIQKN